ncbi:hypothetical protein [Nocardiopsis rhodophaea]|uniref:hypothetical protein n=1 Tax=Nocardiopsis rhodophaea TaxID=280238 RepID=UPI0031D57A9D
MLQRTPAHLGEIFTHTRERAHALGYSLTWYRCSDGWRYTLTHPCTGFKRTFLYLSQVQQHLRAPMRP